MFDEISLLKDSVFGKAVFPMVSIMIQIKREIVSTQ